MKMYFVVDQTMRREEVSWHIVRMEVAPLARVQDVESLEGVDFSIIIEGNGRGGALMELATDSV